MNTIVKFLLLAVLAIGGAIVFVGCSVYSGYQKTVTLDENVKKAWSDVENKLTHRFDVIPNLVETVKGIVGHENEVFLGVAEARKSYFQANGTSAKAEAATGYMSALSRLLVLKETYPNLKSNENFLKLQDEIAGMENRLSVERRRFNEAVRDLNTYIRGPIGALCASLASVEKAEYFEAEEEAKEVPKVDFGG